jgi:hypothetical protein
MLDFYLQYVYIARTYLTGICALDANKLTKHQMESRALRGFCFLHWMQ